ncbi:efflux RND transporter periplasmic adaptor subunit [Elongatibacter sediminis]|uniref:Efflux RND transporter periplasmic adaptor subunit n=1 Tax=Elongatibacter sediminis TaxID=3119006 RepID=A0AAW9R9M8_9GAMM
MPSILARHPYITLTAVAVAALLAWGFWPEPVRVELATVGRAPLVVTIEEEGRTRVMDRYVVSAPVDGVACRLELEVGDAVSRGELLLNISPLASRVLDSRSRAQAEAAVAAARASLQSAGEQSRAAVAAADLAASELARLTPLMEQGVVSRDAFDRAQAEARRAEAARQSAAFQVDVARHELEAARTALEVGSDAADGSGERVPVRSPIDGRLLARWHECEGPVRTGDPLLEVGDPSALEVVVELLSADAVRVRPGMDVVLDRWGGAQGLEGRVRTVEPTGFTKVSALGVEEQRVRVIVDITSEPERWRRLGDGYRIEARFVLWRDDDVLQVPASSLFRQGEGWSVFAVEGGRARMRTVAVGHRTGLAAQVLEGLSPGETVITYPSDAIEDGIRVRPWTD